MKIRAKRVSGFEKYLGLMFKSRENAEPIVLDFSRDSNASIHSFFVFFPFIAVWLDENNQVIDMFKVKPNCIIKPYKKFRKVLEIPIKNDKNF